MATHQGFSIRAVGARTIDSVLRLGYATRFIARTIASSGTSLKRPRLVIRELYFTGVLSLIIILVSGLFVGMVLGYQGYYTLQTYGSESALGVLVALSLVRELGPVMAALLFASRAPQSGRGAAGAGDGSVFHRARNTHLSVGLLRHQE